VTGEGVSDELRKKVKEANKQSEKNRKMKSSKNNAG
jgi:hypothetical protein